MPKFFRPHRAGPDDLRTLSARYALQAVVNVPANAGRASTTIEFSVIMVWVMSIYPPDDVDFIDLSDHDSPNGGHRRQTRGGQPPQHDDGGLPIDPRFLVPGLLFLLALIVITLAWSSRGGDDTGTTAVSEEPVATSEIAQSVLDAEQRAGFEGLSIEEVDGVLVINGEAANQTDVAAIGAVARSVEGSPTIDNRVMVVGDSIDTPFPIAESGVTNGGADLATQLNNLGRITFETGSADLTAEGTLVVENVARVLEQSPGVQIEIHGHTDSDGDETTNQVLSQQRAEAVSTALSLRGIDIGRLTAVGFGESNPIAPNVTDDGRATNRRIEFVVAS